MRAILGRISVQVKANDRITRLSYHMGMRISQFSGMLRIGSFLANRRPLGSNSHLVNAAASSTGRCNTI
jgi:hypothetical protein